MGCFLLWSLNLPQETAFLCLGTKTCQGVFIVFIIRIIYVSVKCLCYTFFMARKRINPLQNPANIKIGKQLAAIRKAHGLTQSQLAEQVCINQRVVSDYEVGRAGISADMLIRLCSVLKCSSDNVIGLKPENKSEKPNLRISRRLKRIEQLPINQQKALLQNIDMFLKGAKLA